MQTNNSPAPTRRTLLAASAWTVPAAVLVSAAPAYANSQRPGCLPMSYELNWGQSGAWSYSLTGNQTPGNGAGQILATPVAAPAQGQVFDPLAITFTNTFAGQMRRAGDFTEGNMIVTPQGVGGTGARGLEMWQQMGSSTSRSANAVQNDRQTITFDFGREVTNLSFTITDIDAHQPDTWSGRGQYRDAVYVSEAPTSVALGSRVQGSGTASSPWAPNVATGTSTGLDNSSDNRGNVRLTYAGPIQALSVTFYNSETRSLTSNGSQAIYFTNFTFTANSCV